MITTLLLAAAMLSHISPECSWDHPGVNRFQGNVADAIDHYKDIPHDIRETLKRRIRLERTDEIVSIGRDRITGQGAYGPEIYDMHFGTSSMCRHIVRGKWRHDHVEPAAVYCEQDQCVIVPRVCNNLSRISRRPPGAQQAPPPPPPLAVREPLGKLDDGFPTLFFDAPIPWLPETLDPADRPEYGSLTKGAFPDVGTPPWDTLWRVDGCHLPVAGCEPDVPVVYAPVPEANSWAMLLSGGTILAGLARRRRRISLLK